MRIKCKLLSVSIITLVGTTAILATSFSYESNAVEKSSVSYEHSINNRGFVERDYFNQYAEFEIEQQVARIYCNTVETTKDKTSSTDKKYMWTTDKSRLRERSDTNSDILMLINKREKVEVLDTKDKWIKIKYKEQIGWIYSKLLRNTELPSLDFTDEEIDLLAKIVWLEARGESDEGEAGIVIVVKNRILSKEFSDTMYEVLSDENQFSSWNLIDKAHPTEREYEIIDETLRGYYDGLLTDDTVYFSTKPRNENIVKKIGNHWFCAYD